MTKINPGIFRAYDIRGRFPDELDEHAAYLSARAFVRYLIKDTKKTLPFKVAVGQDMRVHSPFVAREVLHGLVDEGVEVVDIGRVSTPALYHAVSFNDYAGGIMVTASHMTKEFNGLKMCAEKALPIAKDSGIEKIKEYALGLDGEKPAGKGSITQVENMTDEYVQQDLSYVSLGEMEKLTIVADPANCMGATYLESLFQKVPVELIRLNWDLNGNMPVHEANPIKPETLQQLKEVVKNEKADFGIATDGDGDRIGFIDERGDEIPADIVTGLVALRLLKRNPGAKIGYDLRFSKAVKEMIEEAGGEPVESVVGHSFIKKMMREKDILFSGELSGHYYFRENYNFESPVFTVAQLLAIRSEQAKPFSEIWRPYQKYFHSGEINFDVADKQAAMDSLEQKYSDGKISKIDGVKVEFADWWFVVRPSANDPVLRLILEADTRELMDEKVKEVSQIITA